MRRRLPRGFRLAAGGAARCQRCERFSIFRVNRHAAPTRGRIQFRHYHLPRGNRNERPRACPARPAKGCPEPSPPPPVLCARRSGWAAQKNLSQCNVSTTAGTSLGLAVKHGRSDSALRYKPLQTLPLRVVDTGRHTNRGRPTTRKVAAPEPLKQDRGDAHARAVHSFAVAAGPEPRNDLEPRTWHAPTSSFRTVRNRTSLCAGTSPRPAKRSLLPGLACAKPDGLDN